MEYSLTLKKVANLLCEKPGTDKTATESHIAQDLHAQAETPKTFHS
jgi:hypothetical protein